MFNLAVDMSKAPPVPAEAGAVFTSTDNAQVPMPAIRVVPDTNPMDLPQYTGNTGTIDPQLYMQKIQIGTETWSSGQEIARKIVTYPIHPSSHPFLAYLSPMYNTWDGGIQFFFRVLGTGFHAGQLAFTRVPPNLVLEDFDTPTKLSTLETVYVDPKDLNAVAIEVMDQRPTMFHMTNIPPVTVTNSMTAAEKFMNSTSFGGHLCMWISGQLNTSSSGSNQIDIVTWVRPAPTFRFAQLIPPPANIGPPTDASSIAILENTLNFKCADRIEVLGGRIATLVVAFPQAMSSMANFMVSRIGGYDFTGKMVNTNNSTVQKLVEQLSSLSSTGGTPQRVDYVTWTAGDMCVINSYLKKEFDQSYGGSASVYRSTSDFETTTDLDKFPLLDTYAIGVMPSYASAPDNGYFGYFEDPVGAVPKISWVNGQSSDVIEIGNNDNQLSACATGKIEPNSSTENRSLSFAKFPPAGTFETNFDPTRSTDSMTTVVGSMKIQPIIPPLDECVLSFCAGVSGAKYALGLQTTGLRRLYENGTIAKIIGNKETAILCEMRSIKQGVAVSYAKVLADGFITVPSVTVPTKFDLSDLEFKYIQKLGRNQPFPKPGIRIEHKIAQLMMNDVPYRGYTATQQH